MIRPSKIFGNASAAPRRTGLPRPRALAFAVVCVCAAGGGLGATTATAERAVTFDVDAVYAAKERGEIDIEVSAGRVQVLGEARDDIEVRGMLGTDVVSWDVFQDGRYARFQAVPPEPPGDAPADLAVDLIFRVPAGTSLNLRSIEGELEVDGIEGHVTVHTATASTRLRGTPRRAEVTSVAGAVDAELVTPDVELKSVSGAVTVGGRIESLIAETVDTPLFVDAEIVAEALLRSVTGNVRMTGRLEDTARLRVETASGAVHLALPADLPGRYRIETSTGELRTDEAGGARPGLHAVRGRRLAEWSIGSEPRQVEVRTVDGNVDFTAPEAQEAHEAP